MIPTGKLRLDEVSVYDSDVDKKIAELSDEVGAGTATIRKALEITLERSGKLFLSNSAVVEDIISIKDTEIGESELVAVMNNRLKIDSGYYVPYATLQETHNMEVRLMIRIQKFELCGLITPYPAGSKKWFEDLAVAISARILSRQV